MSVPDKAFWNEFDWEKELRKDDARVSAYIAELPKYIDLPDEDGIIMRTIKRRADLAREEDDWLPPGPVPYDSGEEDQENIPFPNSDHWKAAPGGALYHNCSVLARDFSVFAAISGHTAPMEQRMRILSLYGKLLARSADLIDMTIVPEPDEDYEPAPVPLQIAVCKRLLGDLNFLAAELRKLGETEAAFVPLADAHCEVIGHMYDYLIDLIVHLRNPAKPEGDAPF